MKTFLSLCFLIALSHAHINEKSQLIYIERVDGKWIICLDEDGDNSCGKDESACEVFNFTLNSGFYAFFHTPKETENVQYYTNKINAQTHKNEIFDGQSDDCVVSGNIIVDGNFFVTKAKSS